jgi:hypothetical protein
MTAQRPKSIHLLFPCNDHLLCKNAGLYSSKEWLPLPLLRDKKCVKWLFKCPNVIVCYVSRSLLRAEIVAHHQIVQRCSGLGVQVVKLSSELIKIGEKVGSVVHRHVAWLSGIE